MDSEDYDNTDWVFSQHSNVHLTNNKSHLTSYTPFTSTVKTPAAFGGSGNVPIQGIGSINLTLRLNKDDDTTYKSITLTDVLYVPKAICNIFSPTAYGDCCFYESGKMTTKAGKAIGETLEIEVMEKVAVLWVEGKEEKGSTLADEGVVMEIYAVWSEEESERWREFQREKEKEERENEKEKPKEMWEGKAGGDGT